MNYQEILQKTIFGNTVGDYLIAVVALLVSFITINLVVRYIIGRIKKIAINTKTTIDDFIISALEKIAIPFLYLFTIFIAVSRLTLHDHIQKGLDYAALAVVLYYGARFVIMLVGYGITLYTLRADGDDTLKRGLNGIFIVAKALIWGGVAVFFLDNVGIKVSAVIAGLGVGGIAVALAAQALLKDLFSYFSIIFDHPFKIGDFIIIGDYMGCIEHVGIKTTRIRSLGGEMIVVSNSDLTDSRVRNYGLMEKRRVLFSLGVTYQTPTAKLKEIPGIIERVIKSIKDTVFDRAHFFSYGDFSLNFEIVYYVMGADYNKYMDVQQAINFAIKEEFEKRGIEFAYPTQTLFVEKQEKA